MVVKAPPFRRKFLQGAAPCAAMLFASVSGAGMAQVARARRIVTGFPAGGPADVLARMLSEKLRASAGESVVVENRTGAGGRIAIEYARTAAADGSVILLVPDATMFLYPYVFRALAYDPERDFKPVARLVGLSFALFVGAAVPPNVRSLRDYLAWVGGDTDRMVYGTPAAGATPHFTGAMFARAVGLPLRPVHYRGGGPGIQDVVAGHLPLFVGGVSDGLPMLRAGKIRALATSGPARAAMLPNVPTFAELGYADLVVQDGLGVYLPAAASGQVVQTLASSVLQEMKSADMVESVRAAGFDLAAEDSRAFALRLQYERGRWAAIVKATGFAAME